MTLVYAAVHWVRGEDSVPVSRSPRLHLTEVRPDMAGSYSCVAANSEGEARQSLQLTVLCE